MFYVLDISTFQVLLVPKAFLFVVLALEYSEGNFAIPPFDFQDVAKSAATEILLVFPEVAKEKVQTTKYQVTQRLTRSLKHVARVKMTTSVV